jgi:hypothetical protein
MGPRSVRAVTDLDVSARQIEGALEAAAHVFIEGTPCPPRSTVPK